MHQALATPSTAPPSPSRKRPSRKRRYILIGLGVLVLLWIGSAIATRGREKPIEVITEQAVRRTIVQTVTATGKVQPEIEVKISPEVAGEIIELPVVDGQAVKKDDLLLRIRPDSYKAQLEAQTASISAARSTSVQLKAAAAKAEQDLKRAQDLYAKKMISESEFVAARTAHEVATATFESSLHDIERAEAASTQARDALSKTTIISPIDGQVTVLNSKLGERVVATGQFAGTEVMRVADLSQMEARVDVNENDVVNVKVGDKATITVDAYGEREFTGTVFQIANTGKTTGAGTQEEVTNFEVRIRLDPADVLLRPGLSCTADIETDVVENVVAVPMQSVTIRIAGEDDSPEELEKRKQTKAREDRGDNAAELTNERAERRQAREEREKLMRVAFLKDGRKARMVQVSTGIADDTYIEIKSGIQPGDEVITGSYSAISRRLKDGSSIELEKPQKKK